MKHKKGSQGAFILNGAVELDIQASAAPNEASPQPKFTINAYNGGMLQVDNSYYPVVIDLAGLKVAKSIPILLDHDTKQIVGVASKIKIDASSINMSGVITGDFTDKQEPAHKVVSHAKAGFNWSASVGVMPTPGKVAYVDRGEKVTVNGKRFEGPLNVLRASTLRETSFLAVGADGSASASIAAAAAKEFEMHQTFAEWLAEKGHGEESTLKASLKKHLKAAYKADIEASADPEPNADPEPTPEPAPEPAPSPDNPLKASAKLQADELRRQGLITASAKKYCAEPEVAAKAIEEMWTADKAELHFLKAERDKAKVLTTRTGSGKNLEVDNVAVEASLCLAAGLREDFVGKQYGEQTMNKAVSRDLRGFGIHAVIYEMLRATGVRHTPGMMTNQTIKDALRADNMIRADAGFTSVALTSLLENVTNKILLSQFAGMNSVVDEICYGRDTKDFKPFSSYRIDSNGAFKSLSPAGELQDILLIDAKYTNQLQTKGGMITLDRTMIINDDMNSFAEIPTIFARLAMHCREAAVIQKLLDGVTDGLFSSANGNYETGTSTALGLASLELAVQKFLEQKDKGGHFMGIMPDRMLTAPANAAMASRIFKSEAVNQNPTVVNSTTGKGSREPSTNIYQGQFRPVISQYLGTASSLTGKSDTGWYLLSAPGAGQAVLQIGYLNGQRTPIIESANTDFDRLGVSTRAYWDFGVAGLEPRAGVLMTGAA